MQSYIVNKKNNNNFYLNTSDEFHLKKVMRAKIDTKIICVYKSKHYLTKITSLDPLNITILKLLKTNNENNYQINLIIGLVKKTKWDFILQKATELGINKIIPFKFENTIIKINDVQFLNKKNRWDKICKEAAEQSKRNIIPTINNKIETKIENLTKFMSNVNFVCYEKSNNNLNEFIKMNFNNKKINSITIVIGSEGGFTKSEIDKFYNIKFNDIKICKQILRSETAVISMLSIMNYVLESGDK